MKWYCLLASLMPLLAHAESDASRDEFDLGQIPYFLPKTEQTNAKPAPAQKKEVAAQPSKKPGKDKKEKDNRKAQTTPKTNPQGVKPSQQKPVLKTRPSMTVQASQPQSKPVKAEPQAGQVKTKTKPVTKTLKRDGSRFSNKYVPAEKKETVQTPRENPRFARKYALDDEG